MGFMGNVVYIYRYQCIVFGSALDSIDLVAYRDKNNSYIITKLNSSCFKNK